MNVLKNCQKERVFTERLKVDMSRLRKLILQCAFLIVVLLSFIFHSVFSLGLKYTKISAFGGVSYSSVIGRCPHVGVAIETIWKTDTRLINSLKKLHELGFRSTKFIINYPEDDPVVWNYTALKAAMDWMDQNDWKYLVELRLMYDTYYNATISTMGVVSFQAGGIYNVVIDMNLPKDTKLIDPYPYVPQVLYYRAQIRAPAMAMDVTWNVTSVETYYDNTVKVYRVRMTLRNLIVPDGSVVLGRVFVKMAVNPEKVLLWEPLARDVIISRMMEANEEFGFYGRAGLEYLIFRDSYPSVGGVAIIPPRDTWDLFKDVVWEHWQNDYQYVYGISDLNELIMPVEIGFDDSDPVKGNPELKWQYFDSVTYLPASGTAIVSPVKFDVADYYARLMAENMNVMAGLARNIFNTKIAMGEVLNGGWLFGIPRGYNYLNMLVPLYLARNGTNIDALEGEIYNMRQVAYEDVYGSIYQDMDLWLALAKAQLRYTSFLAHTYGKKLIISETNLDGRWIARPKGSCYNATEIRLATQTFLLSGADWVIVFEIDPDDNNNPWSMYLNYVSDSKLGIWEPLSALMELSSIAQNAQEYASAKPHEVEPIALLMPFETDLAAWAPLGGDHRAIMGILVNYAISSRLIPMPIEVAYELRDKLVGLIVMSIYGRGLATEYEVKLLNNIVASGVTTLVLGRVSLPTNIAYKGLWMIPPIEAPLNLTEYILVNVTVAEALLTKGLNSSFPTYCVALFSDEVLWQGYEGRMVQGYRAVGNGVIYYVGIGLDMWQSWPIYKQQVEDRWVIVIKNFIQEVLGLS